MESSSGHRRAGFRTVTRYSLSTISKQGMPRKSELISP
jgi:hypothetical protein